MNADKKKQNDAARMSLPALGGTIHGESAAQSCPSIVQNAASLEALSAHHLGFFKPQGKNSSTACHGGLTPLRAPRGHRPSHPR